MGGFGGNTLIKFQSIPVIDIIHEKMNKLRVNSGEKYCAIDGSGGGNEREYRSLAVVAGAGD